LPRRSLRENSEQYAPHVSSASVDEGIEAIVLVLDSVLVALAMVLKVVLFLL
jgi:hypothetical protein